MKDKEQNRQAQLRFQLEVRKLEIEADTVVRLCQLELEAQLHAPLTSAKAAGMLPPPTHPPIFDIGKHISLVPIFRETEEDAYFGAFQRIAAALQWPLQAWPLLLQCKVHGKAQEAVAALSLEDSLNYDSVKAAIMRAYELVPEAYRQKCSKAQNQSTIL